MPKPSEYWSEELAHSSGKPDANLATDALQLGGIDAEDYATKRYVQDFHNNKEELLKQYIDSQDIAKLQEAKDYVDTMIRNQDFSSFAKLTDLQSLSAILSTKIEACKTECQQEMNTRINAVVSDVNSNFDDVNGAIDTLNTRTNELFTSVSNGKELIADAITDKGIHTSANDSYKTMATNIKNIQTEGGGEYDENYVNTADGNATENDVALGKIAYAKGRKLYGTHTDLDTSDATANEADIAIGKTAYVNGIKLTGTSRNTSYPTNGTDTQNATATSADILKGKTAYARGQLLVGTLSSEVEEVYENISNEYELKTGNPGLIKYLDSDDIVTYRYCVEFSKDLNYCVSGVRLNNDSDEKNFFIESHAVVDESLIIQASAGIISGTTYKKYRYTKSELGIEDEEKLLEIKLGTGGLLGHAGECLLLIRTDKYLHFYTYHLYDNGVIGKSYDDEKYIIDHYKTESPNYTQKNDAEWIGAVFSNTDPYSFFRFIGYNDKSFQKGYLTITPINENDLNISLNYFPGIGINSSNDIDARNLDIIGNDWTILGKVRGINAFSNSFILELNEDSILINKDTIYNGLHVAIESLEKFFKIKNNQLTIDSKTINISGGDKIIDAVATENKILFLIGTLGGSGWSISKNSLKICVCDIDNIMNSSDGSTIQPIQSFELYNQSATKYCIKANPDKSKFIIYDQFDMKELWVVYPINPDGVLIGIKYKNQFFRSTKPQLLSATVNDVANGKTFIGYYGTVQTGTLETTTEENLEETTT